MNVDFTVGMPVPAGSVTVAYSGTAGTTAALPYSSNVLRLFATTDCFVEITQAGTAAVANTGMYLVGGVPEYIHCLPKSKVSAIQVSSAGNLYVTPML